MQQYHHGAAQCPRRLDPFRIGTLGISLSLTGFRRLADNLRIPTHSGQAYRFDAGHRSEMKPATVPI
jgi:hypothetical protein